jgi:hypothetical protein
MLEDNPYRVRTALLQSGGQTSKKKNEVEVVSKGRQKKENNEGSDTSLSSTSVCLPLSFSASRVPCSYGLNFEGSNSRGRAFLYLTGRPARVDIPAADPAYGLGYWIVMTFQRRYYSAIIQL